MNSNCNLLGISNDLPYEVRSSRFIEFFEAHLSDSLSVLDDDIRPYALQSALAGGKRIRPLLVFHFAGRSEVLYDSTIKASVILEIVHLASLIHDDILDGAEIRRNLPSMHEKIGSHAAVLLGDALFGFALELASQFPTTRICSIVSEATRKTCSGEIRQTFARGRPDLSLDEYLSFINDKTGELFRASCQIGAYLSGAKQDTINLAGEFGLSLGINYQVFDDLIDSFEDPGNSDKSLGSDWETGKMTLPVILLREVASVDEIKILDQLIRSGRDSNPEKNIRSQILELFEKYEILPKCIQYFEESFSRTQSLIDQFPNTHLRDDLNAFIQSFTLKFTKLTNLKTSNFLAL
jgi:octaprenyl-diphosphate synthase